MAIKRIETKDAPKAIGPYSQGVSVSSGQNLIFVSGQLPVNPSTGELLEGNIREQTIQVIDNLEAVLRAAGAELGDVVRVDIFLKNLQDDFQTVNEEYAKRFDRSPAPARQTIQVGDLPLGSPIEISCIAASGENT